jgi:hypothetical protein
MKFVSEPEERVSGSWLLRRRFGHKKKEVTGG